METDAPRMRKRSRRTEYLLVIAGVVSLALFTIAGAVEGWQADAELRTGRWTVWMWTPLIAGVLCLLVAAIVCSRRSGRH